MHAVSKIDPAAAQTPQLYQQHSTGFRRATYVDRAMGSVHMGTGICFLDAGRRRSNRTCIRSKKASTFWKAASRCRSARRRTRSAPAISD